MLFGANSLRNREGVEVVLNPFDFTGAETPGAHDCLWIGPVNYKDFNIAFPDKAAAYWPTVFKLPAGSTLEIKGTYPKARYMSFHSYNKGYAPYDNLSDQEIGPDAGTDNPFTKAGVKTPGTYTIRVVAEDIPANPDPNTLYLSREDIGLVSPLILRTYVSETPGDLTGGAGLPRATLITASGDRLSGQDMCEAIGSPAIGSKERTLRAPIIGKKSYEAMLNKNDLASGFPASNPTEWLSFWDPKIDVMRIMSRRLLWISEKLAQYGLWKKTSGFYAAIDNEYVSAYINTNFGKVLLLEGKLPHTPKTGWDWPGGSYDLRYWSICTNEGLATTRFVDCRHDSQIKTDADMTYRIVISRKADRPANATGECGASWLNWGDAGDGAGHKNIGVLIIRNMLASPDFKNAIQRVPVIGDEAETMGNYGLAPITVIDTDEGLIAFDTGDSKHDGEVLLKAIRTVSDKPVKAIIYGHSHTVLGAGVLAEGNEDIMVIGHPNLNAVFEQNLASSGIPAYFPEIGPYLTARALIQFNAYMPKEGPDAYVVPLTLACISAARWPSSSPRRTTISAPPTWRWRCRGKPGPACT